MNCEQLTESKNKSHTKQFWHSHALGFRNLNEGISIKSENLRQRRDFKGQEISKALLGDVIKKVNSQKF